MQARKAREEELQAELKEAELRAQERAIQAHRAREQEAEAEGDGLGDDEDEGLEPERARTQQG